MKNKFLPLNAMSAATCLALVAASSASAGELGHMRLPTNQTIAIEPTHEAHVIVDQGAQMNGGASFSSHGAGEIEKVRGGVRSWFVAEQPREAAVLYPKSDEQEGVAKAFNPATDGIVFFAFNKSAPLDAAQLKRVATAAVAHSADVKVVGHADEVGSDRYNMRLSTRRAKAVADYLIDAGVSPDQISYVGRGKREPVDLDNPAKNRRAVITFAAAKGVKPQ
jgi:OOP family OmpA-OmpF porin